jgi:hypothetical protein
LIFNILIVYKPARRRVFASRPRPIRTGGQLWVAKNGRKNIALKPYFLPLFDGGQAGAGQGRNKGLAGLQTDAGGDRRKSLPKNKRAACRQLFSKQMK